MARRDRRVTSYSYKSASRANLPTEQTEPVMSAEDKSPRPYAPTRRRSEPPALAWERGKTGEGDHTHPGPPLYIREKIHPRAFVESLKAGAAPPRLFDEFNGAPTRLSAAYEWYQHPGSWQNRIVHGESARVMASLLEREAMKGRVQMIYFDPPYGIGFKSNFQVSLRSRETPENRKGLPYDTRTVRAFRDTYEREIHSYLDQMREKLTLCRDLLSESGSIFVQIGDENVHRVALVCDEVFGHENRVSTISFATSGSSSAATLPSVADYLLWYAKDKRQMKYRQLYESLDRREVIHHFSWHAMVEMGDGVTRKLTTEERADPDKFLPSDARLYRRMRLTSQGRSTTGRSDPYSWEGNIWPCPQHRHWAVSMEGLDRMAELGRLDAAGSSGELAWKWYEDEVPGRKIHNLWHSQMSTTDKRYVVQTADQVIQRCILMTTDPGDLVFDPTCGGATTAHAAEKWGRRWITCDTSPIAVAIARQRIATATFPNWLLSDSAEGAARERQLGGPALERSEGFDEDPTHGFVYRRTPKVSAAILAYDQDVPPVMLVDRPYEAEGAVRVASPFTVESESPHAYLPVEGDSETSLHSQPVAHGQMAERVTEALLKSGIKGGRKAADLRITEIENWPGPEGLVSHRAVYTVGEGVTERVAALSIAAEDVTVTAEMIRAAATEAGQQVHGTELLIVVGFAFDADSSVDQIGRVKVARVNMNRDLQVGELRDAASDHAFVMMGQPDVEVEMLADGQMCVELLGYDTYNPATGNVSSGKPDDVACWMVDTDHDGISFFARRLHFPGAHNDRQIKRLQRALGKTIDKLSWDAALSNRSAPFDPPKSGKVAVKIITTTGAEMSVVKNV